MLRRVMMWGLMLWLVAAPARAQDDDDGDAGFYGRFTITAPALLSADTLYDFEFSVENASAVGDGAHWVYLVEVFMPSADYDVDEDVYVPDALHGGEWSAEIVEDIHPETGIQWQHTTATTSASWGDIREGEFLEFGFRARTDEEGTDGFDWRLVSGSGEFDTGTAFITPPEVPFDDDGEPPPDTHDDPPTPPDEGDDDDDEDGGCGC